MEADKLIHVINGMLFMVKKEENPDDWTKDFLNHVKSTIEGQQEDLKMYREYLDREKDRSYLLDEKVKQYEKALKDMQENRDKWMFSHQDLEQRLAYLSEVIETDTYTDHEKCQDVICVSVLREIIEID